MKQRGSITTIVVGACAAMLIAVGFAGVQAQQAAAPAQGAAPAAARGGGGFGGGGRGATPAGLISTAADADKDGCVSRVEMRTTFDNWFTAADTSKNGMVTADQLATAIQGVPAPPAAAAAGGGAAAGAGAGGFGGGGRGGQNQTPVKCDVDLMMAQLPDKAYAKPAQPHKVLVLGRAQSFVHSSIPLAAKTIEALGTKTGAWSTTITYDPADINAGNLKQYDAVFLDSTTGCFLDATPVLASGATVATPEARADAQKLTDARRAALLDFVRGGKGLAGIHAATDSYHGRCPADAPPAADAAGGRGAGGGGGRGARGAAAPGAAGAPAAAAAPAPAPPAPSTTLAMAIVSAGDKNRDQKLSRAEMTAVADAWFDTADTAHAGKVRNGDFSTRLTEAMPSAGTGAGGGRGGAPMTESDALTALKDPSRGTGAQQKGSWPEFNTMIGGFFKWHWSDPQEITVKIDDPKSPLTQMFGGKEYVIHDETYTMAQDSFSRKNAHILTSIDYGKMSPVDKAKETASDARTDGDYALSWIRREGKGRVFYEAHGHSERNYAVKPLLEHVLAGMQYVLGDLKADDSPSVK